MHRTLLLTLLCLLLLHCKKSVEKATPVINSHKELVKGQGLSNVESIVFDSISDQYFVSCGKSYQPGYDGYISRISGKGELLNLKWIDSLNRPTGMAIRGRKLYVADLMNLLVIDLDKDSILSKFEEPIKNSGLNDVAISEDGEVYVSASAKSAIYKLEDEKLNTWLQDATKLKWVNGLVFQDGSLLAGGISLHSIDMNTKNISALDHNPSISDIEGISPDGNGGLFITTVENSALWHLDAAGKAMKLHSEGDYYGDLQFVSPNKVVVPRGNHETGRFYISVYELEK